MVGVLATAALAAVGPTGPVLAEPEPVIAPAPAPRPDTRCLKRWRLIHAGAQVADAATTIHGIGSGKGTEANPLIRLIAGKRPDWYEIVGVKLATFGLIEWQAQRALSRGDAKAACNRHKTGAIITAGVAAINLRILF